MRALNEAFDAAIGHLTGRRPLAAHVSRLGAPPRPPAPPETAAER